MPGWSVRGVKKRREREIGQRMNGGAQDTSDCHIFKKHLLHAKEFWFLADVNERLWSGSRDFNRTICIWKSPELQWDLDISGVSEEREGHIRRHCYSLSERLPPVLLPVQGWYMPTVSWFLFFSNSAQISDFGKHNKKWKTRRKMIICLNVSQWQIYKNFSKWLVYISKLISLRVRTVCELTLVHGPHVE